MKYSVNAPGTLQFPAVRTRKDASNKRKDISGKSVKSHESMARGKSRPITSSADDDNDDSRYDDSKSDAFYTFIYTTLCVYVCMYVWGRACVRARVGDAVSSYDKRAIGGLPRGTARDIMHIHLHDDSRTFFFFDQTTNASNIHDCEPLLTSSHCNLTPVLSSCAAELQQYIS